MKAKPFIIVFAFWILLFVFVMGGFSGEFGAITGYSISDNRGDLSASGVIILVLFLTNIITMFFLIREKLN